MSANACAELGTLNARTVIVYVPAAGALSVTCSTLLRRSAEPPVVDWLFENTLPRNVPDGPETWRSRSLLRFTLAAGVDGKSVHASVTRSDCPAATLSENVLVCPVAPCAKPASSATNSVRAWPVKNSVSSSSTRPQPWQLLGTGPVPVPVIVLVELSKVALTSAALGLKRFAVTAAPVG